MRKWLPVLAAFLPLISLAQQPAIQQKAIILKTMVQRKHFSPRAVDDSLSAALFNLIMENADPRRLFFTANDYKQLLPFKQQLDEEIQGAGWAFLDKFSALWQNALRRADTLINKVTQKPFDFSAAETLTRTKKADEFHFAENDAALLNRWSRYMKYQALTDAYEMAEPDDAKSIAFKDVLGKKEAIIREAGRKAELKQVHRLLNHPQGYAAMVNTLYLNALASCFDPHTNYFSPEEKEQLQAELSTEGYFFGIVFDEEEDGKIVVKQLSPGAPAWKSGAINKGDELLSLTWEGKEIRDMSGATLEEVYEVLDQSNHDKLMFRFRKADGTISNVMLRKEKTENEENVVKGFILKGEKKIGYIMLPGFYTEWENETGSSCANDVAREILKLKKEQIDGLILDVRFNGGGSLGEAMEMTGIFIDEGPLAAEKFRDGKLLSLKDPNRGTIYDGPMVLMINGQSASASEMLAASLQDYNRAVIVGSNSYGKATMQQLFPLDTITSRPITGNEKRDIVKITVGKLYRVNGGTSQLNGVQPDLQLPDAFEGLESGERFLKYSLPADSVKRNSYYKPLSPLPLKELATLSKARLVADADFISIRKLTEEIKRMNTTSGVTIPLKADLYEKWAAEQALNLEMIKGEAKTTSQIFSVENHTSDKQFLKDEYSIDKNKEWLQQLAEDIYLREAFLILGDLINLKKNTH